MTPVIGMSKDTVLKFVVEVYYKEKLQVQWQNNSARKSKGVKLESLFSVTVIVIMY